MTKPTMQALMLTDIGRLELQTLPRPEPTRPDEVLLAVKAAGICGSDLHGYTGASGRRQPPLIMGHEATAQVLEVGEAVTNVQPGARVAIMPLELKNGARRLMGMDAPGAYATHVVWAADRLFPLPDTLSYEAGALAEPLAVALHAVGLALRLEPQPKVAFIAGAGMIGLAVAGVLLDAGVEIVMSDVSAARLQVARDLGVTYALDPLSDDISASIRELTGGRGAALSVEAVGISATVAQSLEHVADGGVALWIGNNHRLVDVDMQAVVTRELRILGSYGLTDDDFRQSLELLAAGRVRVDALISRQVALKDAALKDSESLFDVLLRSPEIIKCLIRPDR